MVRRFYTRVIKRAPKKRWASHIENFYLSGANYAGATISAESIALVKSLAITSADNVIPTPVIIKTGRYEAQIHCKFDLSGAANKDYNNYNVAFYMFFIPQGWAIDPGLTPVNFGQKYLQVQNLILSHPEWIIARRMIADWYETPQQNAGTFDSKSLIISSKLKRNLNSGDQIMCALVVEKMAPAETPNYPFSVKMNATVTYKTCAN